MSECVAGWVGGWGSEWVREGGKEGSDMQMTKITPRNSLSSEVSLN